MEIFLQLLVDILYVIIVGSVPVVAKYIVSYLDSKKKQVDIDTNNKAFQDTLSDAIEIIQKVVDTVSQKYVESLKASGEFTEEAQIEAFNKALNTSKLLISAESQRILRTAYTDIDEWIKVQIESYIKLSK